MWARFPVGCQILNPQPNPQNAMSYTTSAYFGSPRGLVSCCKTYPSKTVTAEVASSSLVVPAIHSKAVRRISFKPSRARKGHVSRPFCALFSDLQFLSGNEYSSILIGSKDQRHHGRLRWVLYQSWSQTIETARYQGPSLRLFRCIIRVASYPPAPLLRR